MLVMLTPSLACAMPICADSPKTPQPGHSPCVEHYASPEDTQKSGDSSDKVNLLIDCMGVDLQTADDQADIKKYDVTDIVAYVSADESLASQPDFINSKIRGPPPDWLARSETHPPIILTTQRFRI